MRFSRTFLPVGVILVAASAAFGQFQTRSSPKVISVEVVIVETGALDTALPAAEDGDELLKVVAQLEKERKIDTISRIRLSAIEGQPAMIQLGRRDPVVTGRQTTPRGASATAVTMENTGTMLSVTGQIESESVIALQIQAEQSRLIEDRQADRSGETNDSDPILRPHVGTLTAKSTISVRSGHTAVLARGDIRADQKLSSSLILVTARVIEIE